MDLLTLVRVLHLTGFALLVTSTLAGWIIFRRYRRLEEYRSKAALLSAARTIGLLSPVAIVLMLITGIGQMHLHGYTLFGQGWLTLKIFFFLIAASAGIIFGVRARTRGSIVNRLAQGSASPDAEKVVNRLDTQQHVFYLIQSTLLLLILLLSVIKPGP